jgi:uncharacterized iron-regulated protein
MAVCPVDCQCVEIEALDALSAPAVVVLGERHAARDDLKLAARAAAALAERAPVTIALEAVDGSKQAAMVQLADGSLKPKQVEAAADWSATWGHAFAPYLPVFKLDDVAFVAAGLKLGKAPEGREVPVPDVYAARLGEMATHHGMDPVAFTRSMAWRDLSIAERSVQGWDGEGFLVILTGRGHVSEGLGVNWQLQQGLTEAPVSSYLLHSEGCATGDAVLVP